MMYCFEQADEGVEKEQFRVENYLEQFVSRRGGNGWGWQIGIQV